MADAKAFGKSPPRSLESFGVAGVLDDKAKVFYCSLFTTRHIGRVSDLIAARLHEEGLDELRLRALLLFGAFEVFRAQGGAPEEASKLRLAEPLVIECGLDEDKVAVGVAFTADEDKFPNLDGLADRIASGKPEGAFETLLREIHASSDCTFVRGQPGIRRVEIVALLGIPGKIDPATLTAKPPVEVVLIPDGKKSETPQVEAYVELGDLNYPELLQESAPGADAPPPSTGEVLVHGCKEPDDAVKIRASNLLEAIATAKVAGQIEKLGEDLIRVKGKVAERDESVFKVAGGSAIQMSDASVVVKGSGEAQDSGASYHVGAAGAADADGEAATVVSQGAKRPGMPAAVSSEESEVDSDSESESESDADSEESPNRVQEVLEKVKNAWPFRFGRRKEVEEEDDEEEDQESTEDEEGEEAQAQSPAKKKKPKVKAAQQDDDEDAEVEADAVDASEADASEDEEESESLEQDESEPKKKPKPKTKLKAVSSGEEDSASEDGAEEADEAEESVAEGIQPGKKSAPAAAKSRKPHPSVAHGASDPEEKGPESADAEADEDTSVSTAAAAAKPVSTADIQKEVQELSTEIETGFEQTVARAQAEVGDIKQEMGTTRAKRWVDGLMSELVTEKARLAESAKQLNASVRQKELEFRNKENLMIEELRRRDDIIRQKNNALARAKDQLSQATMSAERLKSAKAGAADDAHYKQKYTLVQKMLNSAKDENSQLTEKIEDLKNQLMSAQMNSSKRNAPSMTDFTALQSKYERAVRQSDEFKKNNQQLLDKLSEAKKERVTGNQDEMKKRLEASMKLATGHQREAERLQQKVEEMQREQMRMQAELNRTTNELKSARSAKAQAQHLQASAAKPAAPAAKPAAPAASGAPGTGGNKPKPPKAA
jgi:hypothetical protein